MNSALGSCRANEPIKKNAILGDIIGDALRENIDKHKPLKTKNIAPQICASQRSLHRKLKLEKTSFKEILDSIKKDKALVYLKSKDSNIDTISTLLGYSDSRSFRRAFQRWTGVTPCQYKRTYY
jgi:AraC-like DNA-binding protein